MQRIVRVLELAGGVMDELCNPSGPRKELLSSHCGEFMQLIKVSFLYILPVSHAKPLISLLGTG